MATLKQATEAVDTSKMKRVSPSGTTGITGDVGDANKATGSTGEVVPSPIIPNDPTMSAFLRSPLPPTNVSPDSLRQYYSGGLVPQFRSVVPLDTTTRGKKGASGTTGTSGATGKDGKDGKVHGE